MGSRRKAVLRANDARDAARIAARKPSSPIAARMYSLALIVSASMIICVTVLMPKSFCSPRLK
jgi:hypothetical protein